MFELGVGRLECGQAPQIHTEGVCSDDDFVQPKKKRKGLVRSGKPKNKPAHLLKSNAEPLLPELAEEQWGPKCGKRPPNNDMNADQIIPLIPHGGTFTYNGKVFQLTNTCNIDGVLTILYALFRVSAAANSFLQNLIKMGIPVASKLLQIFGMLNNGRFMEAKRIVVTEILKLKPSTQIIDVYESECRLMECLRDIVLLRKTYTCCNDNCPVQKSVSFSPFSDYAFHDDVPIKEWFTKNRILSSCDGGCPGSNPIVELNWGQNGAPPFFGFPIPYDSGHTVTEEHVPKKLTLIDKKYHLIAYTIGHGDHFYAVFVVRSGKIIYDGVRPEKMHEFHEAPAGHHVSTAWYSFRKFASSA